MNNISKYISLIYLKASLIVLLLYCFQTHTIEQANIMIDVSFRNDRNLKLKGFLWQAPSQSIIIMAHGSASNRFAKGLFTQIAQALQKENYNILSFDFSGHGTSQNDILTLENAKRDLRAAIAFSKEKGFKRITLLGHSLGALTCLQAFTPEIETMILIGALTGPVQWKWDNRLTPEQAECLKKYGYILAEVNDGLRKELKVDGNLLNDIKAINQEALLSNITCPVLIIHGDADQDELDLYALSKQGLPLLPKESHLEIIKGAPHDFLNTTYEVISLIKQWLSTHFPLKKHS